MTFVIAPESFFTCGFFGGILYLVFFIVSTVQTWKAWLLLYDPHHMKMMFHFCMTLYALFETLYCGSLMLHNGYALWGYSSHLVALFCYVYAFLTVIYLWGNTMAFGNRFEYPRRAGLVIVYTNLLITIITIACLFASGSYSNFQDKFSYINLLLILVHSISLMLLACGMLWYGIRLQQKLGRTSIKASPGRNRKIDILLRINAVLLVCNVCFFLRILALGLLCSDIILGNNITDRKIYLLGWFLISNWIPTLFPVRRPHNYEYTTFYMFYIRHQLCYI